MVYISLMISNVGSSVMYLMIIFMSLEKRLFSTFAHFKIRLFIFLLLSCKCSLYILDFNPLLYIWFANIFSHSIGCLFILLIFFLFLYRNFFVQRSLSCLFLPLLFKKKNHWKYQCQGADSLCFLLGVLWFQVKVLSPLWVYFCVWCNIVARFHSSAYGYPVFPTSFIENTILFSLYILGSFVIN